MLFLDGKERGGGGPKTKFSLLALNDCDPLPWWHKLGGLVHGGPALSGGSPGPAPPARTRCCRRAPGGACQGPRDMDNTECLSECKHIVLYWIPVKIFLQNKEEVCDWTMNILRYTIYNETLENNEEVCYCTRNIYIMIHHV